MQLCICFICIYIYILWVIFNYNLFLSRLLACTSLFLLKQKQQRRQHAHMYSIYACIAQKYLCERTKYYGNFNNFFSSYSFLTFKNRCLCVFLQYLVDGDDEDAWEWETERNRKRMMRKIIFSWAYICCLLVHPS